MRGNDNMVKRAIYDNNTCRFAKNRRDDIIRMKKANLNVARQRRHEVKMILEEVRDILNARLEERHLSLKK